MWFLFIIVDIWEIYIYVEIPVLSMLDLTFKDPLKTNNKQIDREDFWSAAW